MRVLLAASLLLLAPRAPGIAVDRCEATGPSSPLVLRTRPENVNADVTWTLTSTECPEEAVVTGGPELLAIPTNVVVGRQYTFEIRGLGQDATQSSFSLWVHGHVVVASATGGRRGPISLSFTVPAYNGPPAPTPAPTATTTTVTTRPHYFEDDRAEI